jgi:hypothetical protein
VLNSSCVCPNADSTGDTACVRLRSLEETLWEYSLPIVRMAERADGREESEPAEYDWSRWKVGAESEDRTDGPR